MMSYQSYEIRLSPSSDPDVYPLLVQQITYTPVQKHIKQRKKKRSEERARETSKYVFIYPLLDIRVADWDHDHKGKKKVSEYVD